MVVGAARRQADPIGRRRGAGAPVVLAAIAAVAGLVMLASSAWIAAVFGSISTQQLLDVVEGRTQLDGGGPGLLVSFLLVCLLAPVLAVAAIAGVATAARRDARREHPPTAASRPWWRPLLAPVAGGLVLLLGAGLLLDRVQLWPYLEAARYDGSVAGYYVAGQTLPPPVDPPSTNLILIYLESFEQAYESPAIMGEDLLAPLTEATDDWMRWETLEQQPGTGWTIAGIVGSQCGIPLKNEALDGGSVDKNALGEAEERFLPGAVCLGDVLEQHGYRSVFLGGADAGFAGKGKFLQQHGYDEVLDRPDWVQRGETDFNAWGLSDHRLLANARLELDELRAQDRPYNLTLLTVDSHEPGLVGPACEQGDDGPVRAAVRCTADEVGAFLTEIERDGVLDDTAVVVMGDHLAMVGATSELADELRDAPRGVFHRMTTPLDVEPQPGSIDHFSILPTTLELLGVEVPGGRLGLGRSAVAPAEGRPPAPVDDTPSLDALAPDQRRLVLEAPSAQFYARLWNPETAAAEAPR